VGGRKGVIEKEAETCLNGLHGAGDVYNPTNLVCQHTCSRSKR